MVVMVKPFGLIGRVDKRCASAFGAHVMVDALRLSTLRGGIRFL
jgi:hypothetical protein